MVSSTKVYVQMKNKIQTYQKSCSHKSPKIFYVFERSHDH
jgi:hypothetical protein